MAQPKIRFDKTALAAAVRRNQRAAELADKLFDENVGLTKKETKELNALVAATEKLPFHEKYWWLPSATMAFNAILSVFAMLNSIYGFITIH